MNDDKKIEEIKKRLETNSYFINPHSDVNVAEDMKYLFSLVEQLRKKNEILSMHNLELTQEMENVRSDFGNNR